jgi:hypothetical protein
VTILASHLRSLAADLLRAADAMQALEAERDEYKRMARLACEIIEREAMPISYADRTQIDVFMSKTGE